MDSGEDWSASETYSSGNEDCTCGSGDDGHACDTSVSSGTPSSDGLCTNQSTSVCCQDGSIVSKNGSNYYCGCVDGYECDSSLSSATYSADGYCYGVTCDTSAPTQPYRITSNQPDYDGWLQDTTPTIAWGPAGDPESGIDHYEGRVNDGSVVDPVTSGSWSPTVSQGKNKIYVRAENNENMEGPWDDGPANLDTVDPTEVSSLQSTSHTTSTWDNDNTIDFSWTAATDATSGLYCYDWAMDTSSSDLGTTSCDTTSGSYYKFFDWDSDMTIDIQGGWGADIVCDTWCALYCSNGGDCGTAQVTLSNFPSDGKWAMTFSVFRDLDYNTENNTRDYSIFNLTSVSDWSNVEWDYRGCDGCSSRYVYVGIATVSGGSYTLNITDDPGTDGTYWYAAQAYKLPAAYTSSAVSDGNSNYFHIKSSDAAGNWDDTSADSGPYWICTDPDGIVDSDNDGLSLTDPGDTCACSSADAQTPDDCDPGVDGTSNGVCVQVNDAATYDCETDGSEICYGGTYYENDCQYCPEKNTCDSNGGTTYNANGVCLSDTNNCCTTWSSGPSNNPDQCNTEAEVCNADNTDYCDYVGDAAWDAGDTAGNNKYRCDQSDQKCRLCNADNTESNHPSSSGADGTCESGCGADSNCDEQATLTCPAQGYICTSSCVYTDRDNDQAYWQATLTCPAQGYICTSSCVYTDRDNDQAYCEDSTGCTAYTWLSVASACCGDDGASDDFENAGSGNSCCINGETVTNGSVDPTEQYLCLGGEIYGCNGNLGGVADQNSSCDRMEGYYCNLSGGSNTWEQQITNGNTMDDCDGSGTGSTDMNSCESSYGYHILDDNSVLTFETGANASDGVDNDGDGFYDEVSAAECRASYDGPPCRNITITHTEMTGETVVDATTWTWGGASEPAAMHIHVYNSTDDLIYDELLNRSCGDTGDENDTWSPSACSYSGGSGSYDCSISWSDLDLRDTLSSIPIKEDVYNITIGVGDGNDECQGGLMGRGGDGILPNQNRNTCQGTEYNGTWCVPTSYPADLDSDCCPVGGTTSEYPGKDDDGGNCVWCWTNNNTQRAGGTGDGLCEQKCGASPQCDEKSPGFSNSTVSCSSTCQVNNQPTHSTPLINSTSGNNLTTDNITCWNQSTSDLDADSVTNIYNWWKDNKAIMLLNMPFDVNVSSTASGAVGDYSGYGNDGTLGGGTSDYAPVWTSSGKVGGAYVFDGTNDYISLPSVNPTQAITVEAWIKSADNTGYSGSWQLVSKYSAYILGTNSIGGSNVCFIIHNSTGWQYGSCYTVPDPDNWHHFVGTFDGLTHEKKIYVDGQLRSTAYPLGTINPDAGSIHIAHRESDSIGTNHFNGTIDGVRIYNHSISLGQANALYQDSKDGYSYKSTIVSQETSNNDQWICGVTPNDGKDNGTTKNSSTLTVGGDAIDGGSETTCDASNPCLQMENSTEIVARFDQFGYVDVKGDYSSSQSSLSPPANSFVVKNSTGDVVLYIDNDGNLATLGTFNQESSPNPSGDNDFVVQNSTDIAGYIDGGTGNMYFKGLLHYNSNF
jgi:hypothetical protein